MINVFLVYFLLMMNQHSKFAYILCQPKSIIFSLLFMYYIIFSLYLIFCHLNLLTSPSSFSSCQSVSSVVSHHPLCHKQIKTNVCSFPKDHSFFQLPSPKCPNLHNLIYAQKAPNISHLSLLLFHWIAMPSFHSSYTYTDSRVRIAHTYIFHHHYHPSFFIIIIIILPYSSTSSA